MKKIIYTLLMLIACNNFITAQAVLPTTWNFANTTLPVGWSEINVNSSTSPYYSGSGNPAPAYKLDNQGDMLIIHFASTPDTLKFDIVGNPPPGNTWSGSVNIEESVNGTSWTLNGTAYTTLSTGYTNFIRVLNASSRYVRFNFVSKSVGNVGLDNVTVRDGVSPIQEISVKQGMNTITNGATYVTSSPVSTMTPSVFTIYNLGLATLNIDSIKITGTNASEFIVGTFPSTVAGTSNSNFNLDFTPTAAGTRTAIMSIYNNDATATPYIINLYGIGGNLATEPTSQASNLNFTNIKSYRYTGSFTASTPAAEGYLVLRRIGAPVTDVPVDGISYQRGDVIGNSKVAYSSSAISFIPNSDVIASTQYYYAVYTYNGPGVYRNYLATVPLTGNVTTTGTMQPNNYYNTIITSNSTFVTDLHNKINPHTLQLYANYGPNLVTKFYARDTTGDKRLVKCVYSGFDKMYSDPWDWTSNNFSREHTYCQSWMPTVNDGNFQSRPEYNDYHMIFPTEQNNVNAIRSNYPLGEVVGTPTYTYLDCKIGNDAWGHKVFEPRDEDKGDAARGMMYQSICYTGVPYTGTPNTNVVYGGSWSFPSYINSIIPYGQNQNVLKKWHYQDPPDNMEIARNDYIDSLQGNRNPFIDSVQFACYVNFANMTKINSPTVPCNNSTIGINELNNSDFMAILPNPNNGIFNLNYVSPTSKNAVIKMYDGFGKLIYSEKIVLNNGFNNMELSLENLSKGIYLFEVADDKSRKTEKIIIQ